MTGKRNGSALLWSVIVFSMFTIFVVSVLSIAAFSHHQTMLRAQEKQAYLSSYSVCNALAKQVEQGDTSLVPDTVNNTIQVSQISLPATMGECSAELWRSDNDTVWIYATTRYQEAEKTVAVKLVQKYEQELLQQGGGGMSVQGFTNDRIDFDIIGDVYISGNTEVIIDSVIDGTLYSEAPVYLTMNSHITGKVIAPSVRMFLGNILIPYDWPAEIISESLLSLLYIDLPESYYTKVDSVAGYLSAPDITIPNVPETATGIVPSNKVTLSAPNNYQLTQTPAKTMDLTVTGSGTLTVKVADNCTWSIGNLTLPETVTFNVVLGENATLDINNGNNHDIKINVYGPLSSTLDLSGYNHAYSGAISVGTLNGRNNNQLQITVSSVGTGGDSMVISNPIGWVISKYEEARK